MLYRVIKRMFFNLICFASKDVRTSLENHSTQLKKLSQTVDILSKENIFLLNTCFYQDHWLSLAKDMHKGKRCFLLGCGPSINKIDLSRLEDEYTMGVNGIFLLDYIQLNYFVTVSHIFWKHYINELKSFKCDRRFIPSYLREFLESDSPTSWLTTIESDAYRRVEKQRPWFFSTQPDRYVTLGGTVIFVCLQILYHMGFSEVILLGIDHDYGIDEKKIDELGVMVNSEDIEAHFKKGYYPKGGKIHIDLKGSLRAYHLANEAYNLSGRKIINASPSTKLDIFPKVDYESLF